MSASRFRDHDRSVETLVDLLALRAQSDPERVGFSFLNSKHERSPAHLTYLELQTKAQAIAAGLRTLGVRTNDRVLLLQPPGLDFVAAFFGVLCAGASAVPAYPPHPARLSISITRLETLVADAKPTAVVATRAIRASAAASGKLPPARQWLATDQLDGSHAAEWYEPEIRRDSVALVQYTSGSTASPKGVLVTHHNLLHNSSVINRAFGFSRETRGVCWLPPYHDMGLIGGLIQPLFGGFPVTLMSPTSFLMRPASWLEAIASERATGSGGPCFAFELCVRKTTPEQRALIDLSRWELAFVGAEPVRKETLDRFAEAFAPSGFRPEAFYPCYGLAESTLFVTGGVKGTRPKVCSVSAKALAEGHVVPAKDGDVRKLVSCGRATPGAKVIIVDPERRVLCKTGWIGEVWTASESVGRGYLNRPEESERVFGGRLVDSDEGSFLRTGDLGFLLEGELFLTGRLKNIIIIGGRNHSAEDIERTVETSHPSMQPGCCAAFSVDLDGEERLIIAAEVQRKPATGREASQDATLLVEAIRRAVAESHDVRSHAVLLLRPATLPKTSSGKPQRHLCRAEFLGGSLSLIEGS
jgi:acyl-CoA synthetase (AMP-forming)/AMP-acid ligase II